MIVSDIDVAHDEQIEEEYHENHLGDIGVFRDRLLLYMSSSFFV